MNIQLELFLQKQVVLLLESYGWLVIQNSQKKGAGVNECFGFKRGVPDLMVLKDKRIIFLELKSEIFDGAKQRTIVGKLSADQKNMHNLIKSEGFEVYTISNMIELHQCLSKRY